MNYTTHHHQKIPVLYPRINLRGILQKLYYIKTVLTPRKTGPNTKGLAAYCSCASTQYCLWGAAMAIPGFGATGHTGGAIPACFGHRI